MWHLRVEKEKISESVLVKADALKYMQDVFI